MIGDFNYDTFKNSIYQLKSMDSEHFTNILAGYNMYKLIHKPTRIYKNLRLHYWIIFIPTFILTLIAANLVF